MYRCSMVFLSCLYSYLAVHSSADAVRVLCRRGDQPSLKTALQVFCGLMLDSWVRCFGMILARISAPISLGTFCVKGTDESILVRDSSVPLIYHYPSDTDCKKILDVVWSGEFVRCYLLSSFKDRDQSKVLYCRIKTRILNWSRSISTRDLSRHLEDAVY